MNDTANTPTPTPAAIRKIRTGVVTSAAQEKTIIVRVDRKTAHPLYLKTVSRSKKYYAHDPNREAKKGDTVRIVETRPLSKLKRWRLLEIVSRAH